MIYMFYTQAIFIRVKNSQEIPIRLLIFWIVNFFVQTIFDGLRKGRLFREIIWDAHFLNTAIQYLLSFLS